MFCVVFMFSCILQVLEVNPSNSKIITKLANLLLDRFNSKLILNLRKEKSAKIRYFRKNPKWVPLSNLIITSAQASDYNEISVVEKIRENSTNMSEIDFS